MEVLEEHRKRLELVNARLTEAFGTPTWHTPQPAIDELVCTILSQNTNDVNRDKAFQKLKEKYESWEAVRDADPGEIMETIRIAGLAAQKGPNIQQALKTISDYHGELSLDWLKDLPPDEARSWLRKIKGVGPKTAAIVLVFSLGVPAFPVDTHIYRVSGRIGLRPAKLSIEKTHLYLEAAPDPRQFRTLHLNLIPLGREICQARKPKCWRCPIVDICQFPEKNLIP